ncbi:Arsenate reductase [Piscirickettsia salmonis]|uniref:Arsenate reductase n=1 Tax=Piscirickettsia salmonis TaxID=1238 RepID=A0A1L6TCA3_PISSA|nr:arsenate reductase (glutaredoxin) [Piscirickettsia salmonis]AKP74062.1 arsenate reductase [Piscirickettsia salmonis LF-89 = ATCC VR-1361]ALB22928.1 arsenate reductase [Piscirickettsia salmonis]ALY02883.1 arsenate reductase [Piscirickettsia salmonis]AMA42438.1 arsenate reductase [Piscirickettsia salmonis]AOS34908.1 arsenate reductase [Piscirickettsia salmonis]
MTTVTIYHNPRCSKSRAALAILEEKGHTANIVEYLKQGINEQEIQQLLNQLDLSIADILRHNEDYYKTHKLNTIIDEKILINHLVQAPKLLQRPIVTYNNKAIIARPPERVLEIL